MMRRLQFAVFITLIAVGAAPVHAADPGSVSGVVRNTAGIPQIGAVVQLLRPDLTVLAVVYTNDSGHFTIPSVAPGRYSVKAMGATFLPSLRENIRVRRATVVNLTLNTLYEVMQWLPAQPRAANAQQDDWAWTLRSAANRPLLRWLEDGPLVVVSDGSSSQPKLRARLVATGGQGTFGESGERLTATIEDTPSGSRELLARVDFDPATDAGMESMLGFRQDLGFAGSVQSLAAVAIQPEIDSEGSQGLDEATIRTWEDMNLGDEFEAQVGTAQVVARMAQASPNMVVAALPFASLGWRKGSSTVHYRMATALPPEAAADQTRASTWLPAASLREGRLVLEHGIHHEFGWERRTDDSSLSVAVFSDRLQNPAIEAGFSGNAPSYEDALVDRSGNLVRVAGANFSSAGVTASFQRRLPAGNIVRLSYANGDALAVPVAAHPISIAQLIAATRPRRVQTYALSLSGTLEGTGTRWRASYRWQPDATVTAVAPFAEDAAAPFMNLHLRQPIHSSRQSGNIEALLDVRNLLAEGYRPFISSDGTVLVFAQDQRAIRAGLVFTF
ncbi:MAG: TonB-dependent receptor [Terracidiphilus sp.]|nr:TonB-dependent receptor [Terracidiphilus sp.]